MSKELKSLTPDEAEHFTREQRIPICVIGGSKDHSGVYIFVPPEGTHFGDKMRGRPSEGYEFISPNGESRGLADMYFVPIQIGTQIQERINAVLDELNG